MVDSSSKPPAEPLLARMIAFVLLAAGVDLWLGHHLGVRLADPGWLSLPMGALAFAAALLDHIVEGAEKDSMAARLRRVARTVLWTPILVFLYVTSIVAGLTFSTLMIIPGDDKEPISASVVPSDGSISESPRKGDSKGGEPLRYLLRVSPFGRSFNLQVAGYLPEVIDVYPLVGARVRPERDLRPSPSVLVRPTYDALRELEDSGWFFVWKISAGGKKEMCHYEGVKGKRSSFLLGRPRTIPASEREEWRRELVSLRVAPGEIDETLGDWLRPTLLSPSSPLEVGMTLEAAVTNSNRYPVAVVQFTLTGESLNDVSLTDIKTAVNTR